MNLPTIKPRWARGDIGREIGSWILAEIREHLLLAGIDGRRINAGNLVGIVPTLAAKIAIFVNMVYKGTWSVLNLSSNFTAERNTDPYFTADPYLSEDWNQALDIDLSDTGVTPGTYGDASFYPTITVDAKGRVTAAGEIEAGAGSVSTNQKRMSIVFQLGDGSTAIVAATEREQWVDVNFSGTIEGYSLLADAAGSIVIDIYKDTYANYPPLVGDSITASAKPTLSSAQKAQDNTLTGWTTAIARGDILKMHVDSAATVKAVALTLYVVKD